MARKIIIPKVESGLGTAEMDKIYIQHQSTSLNQAQSRTLPFLGYLITINLAYMGVIYGVKEIALANFTGWKNHLSILFFVFNLCLGIIYFRELSINRILHNIFYKRFVDEKCGDDSKNIKNAILKHDAPFRKLTGKIILFLYIFLILMTLGNIIFFQLGCNSCCGYWILAIVTIISVFLTCWLSCLIEKRTDVRQLSSYGTKASE